MTKVDVTTAAERARDGWKGTPPDWIVAMADQIDATSQNATAKLLGVSVSQVSYVLRNKYSGSTERIEEAVRGVLMNARIHCPMMIEPIGPEVCRRWAERGAKGVVSNSFHRRMKAACATCPKSHLKKKEH